MNILYFSFIYGVDYAGPNHSIPASVVAQAKVDNVMWINLIDVDKEEWKTIPAFHNAKEWSHLNLKSLPEPFNHPDAIIFEELYSPKYYYLSREARRMKVPYFIVPRGCLTSQAYNNKSKWKKAIANPLIFDPIVRKAKAIQFLSEGEKKNSMKELNKNSFILPNGYNVPKIVERKYSKDQIKGVFIGRIDIYQKGLDFLMDALYETREKLKSVRFTLSIYGPDNHDAKLLQSHIEERKLSDIVSIHNAVFGEEKENVLLSSDVFFLTSRSEGHPMGLVEAMAYGLPSFVTVGTGQKDNVEKNHAGWGCSFIISDMVKALNQMANERDSISVYGESARELAKQYNWDQLALSFHHIISNYINL